MKRRDKGAFDIATIYHNPKYRGRYVIVVGKEVYSTKSGRAHARLLERLMSEYPDEKPLVTYIPKEDTLILIF